MGGGLGSEAWIPAFAGMTNDFVCGIGLLAPIADASPPFPCYNDAVWMGSDEGWRNEI